MGYETSTDANTSVQSRVINAFFDTAGAAKKAVDDLSAAGIPREHITQTDGNTAGEPVTARAPAGEDKGFWEGLKDLFLPEEDRYTYAEGLRRGGYLVSVRADEANYNRVMDILDNDGSVDMDEREGQWRSEGWTGFSGASAVSSAGVGAVGATGLASSGGTTASRSPGSAPITGTSSNYASDTAARTAALGTTTTAASAPIRTGATGTLDSGKDEVVSLYEEQLRVGKRDVSHGKVRLRSYVVETPVSEQVSLRSETVSVDRKPVDRPVTGADALFQERVIEVEEHAEEAVISKEARVTEEITLRKTADTTNRTVTDSVRSTKVDIEDGRGVKAGAVSSFSAQTDAARIVEHMDVISADGQKIGTVDHLDGPDRIKLAKNTSPDGQHHYVPFAWIDHIDQHVHLKRTLADIKADAKTFG